MPETINPENFDEFEEWEETESEGSTAKDDAAGDVSKSRWGKVKGIKAIGGIGGLALG
jgi:hypothetical protein